MLIEQSGQTCPNLRALQCDGLQCDVHAVSVLHEISPGGQYKVIQEWDITSSRIIRLWTKSVQNIQNSKRKRSDHDESGASCSESRGDGSASAAASQQHPPSTTTVSSDAENRGGGQAETVADVSGNRSSESRGDGSAATHINEDGSAHAAASGQQSTEDDANGPHPPSNAELSSEAENTGEGQTETDGGQEMDESGYERIVHSAQAEDGCCISCKAKATDDLWKCECGNPISPKQNACLY